VQRRDLEYPFIVKPCKGFLSEGVFKIHSPEELASAIGSVNLDRHGAEFVLEAYCDGPEVDINFVLSEGELLFCKSRMTSPRRRMRTMSVANERKKIRGNNSNR
jgi:biotin carboxylase